ncbi:unnamed protein product [Sphagnum troendelagicum]|uniref:Uncharacterized protein n=1 Tax=Sphagnum troendelagicum TaxID=128251 RepID=A0ABP0UQ38_9BRYO
MGITKKSPVVVTITDGMAKEHDSIATIWTNDKHSSYLNSIEAIQCFHVKRHKSRQQALAWKDLEMLKQNVAGQWVPAEVAMALVSPEYDLPDQAFTGSSCRSMSFNRVWILVLQNSGS